MKNNYAGILVLCSMLMAGGAVAMSVAKAGDSDPGKSSTDFAALASVQNPDLVKCKVGLVSQKLLRGETPIILIEIKNISKGPITIKSDPQSRKSPQLQTELLPDGNQKSPSIRIDSVVDIFRIWGGEIVIEAGGEFSFKVPVNHNIFTFLPTIQGQYAINASVKGVIAESSTQNQQAIKSLVDIVLSDKIHISDREKDEEYDKLVVMLDSPASKPSDLLDQIGKVNTKDPRSVQVIIAALKKFRGATVNKSPLDRDYQDYVDAYFACIQWLDRVKCDWGVSYEELVLPAIRDASKSGNLERAKYGLGILKKINPRSIVLAKIQAEAVREGISLD